jgi:hypothetical protein
MLPKRTLPQWVDSHTTVSLGMTSSSWRDVVLDQRRDSFFWENQWPHLPAESTYKNQELNLSILLPN